jgi:hypothetical protein
VTDRFDGFIAGLGTPAGLRVVVGHWPSSPFGAFTDVMAERPGGHRMLLAPTEQVAGFVAGTYTFDEVCRTPVDTTVTVSDGRLPGAVRSSVAGAPCDARRSSASVASSRMAAVLPPGPRPGSPDEGSAPPRGALPAAAES